MRRWLARIDAVGADWIARRHPPADGDILIDHRRAYILPTRPGLVFAGGVVILLIGSINYALQLGFLLTFLAAAIAIVGMYHTQRNLTGLVVSPHGAQAVFAGDSIAFQLTLHNASGEVRPAVGLSPAVPRLRLHGRQREPQPTTAWYDVPAAAAIVATVPVPTRRRGRHACPTIRITTRYPFGLFRSWSFVSTRLAALVYPAPEADPPPLPAGRGASPREAAAAAGGDDLAGIRPYRVGDPRRAIAWRLAARTDELLVKLFEVPAGGELMLDFEQLPPQLDTEQKLSRLTRWLLAAEAAGLPYGLALPGYRLDVGSGPAHRERCLEALALFPG